MITKEIFEITHKIDNPYALAAFISLVFAIVISAVLRLKATGSNLIKVLNRLLGAFAFGALMLVFYLIITLYFERKNYEFVTGTVKVNNKNKGNINVMLLNTSVKSSENGYFLIKIYKEEIKNQYDIRFKSDEYNLDTSINIGRKEFDKIYLLQANDHNELTPKIISKVHEGIKENKIKTFSLLPSGIKRIEDKIKKKGLLVSRQKPDFQIQITYSGEIEKLPNELYRYRGGNVIIKVNTSECCKLETLKLPYTFIHGNSKEKVFEEINIALGELAGKNEDLLFNEIIKCIR